MIGWEIKFVNYIERNFNIIFWCWLKFGNSFFLIFESKVKVIEFIILDEKYVLGRCVLDSWECFKSFIFMKESGKFLSGF